MSNNIKIIRNLLSGDNRERSKKISNESIHSEKTSGEETSHRLKKDDSLSASLFNAHNNTISNDVSLSNTLKKSNFGHTVDLGLSPEHTNTINQIKSPQQNTSKFSSFYFIQLIIY